MISNQLREAEPACNQGRVSIHWELKPGILARPKTLLTRGHRLESSRIIRYVSRIIRCVSRNIRYIGRIILYIGMNIRYSDRNIWHMRRNIRCGDIIIWYTGRIIQRETAP
jgi:hypothetical protein